MRRLIIHITSLAKGVLVTVRQDRRRTQRRRFRTIDEAVEFVLPLGNRHTELYLNGYPCVLHGWVA